VSVCSRVSYLERVKISIFPQVRAVAVIIVLRYGTACDNPARPLAVCGFSRGRTSAVYRLVVYELYIALWGNCSRPLANRMEVVTNTLFIVGKVITSQVHYVLTMFPHNDVTPQDLVCKYVCVCVCVGGGLGSG